MTHNWSVILYLKSDICFTYSCQHTISDKKVGIRESAYQWLNSSVTWRCIIYSKSKISEYMFRMKLEGTSCEIALRWIPQNTDDKSISSCNDSAPSGNNPGIAWANVDTDLCPEMASLDHIDHLMQKHDDVIKWKHFPRNCSFVRGIHRSRRIPHTKASDAELWCFLWSASE